MNLICGIANANKDKTKFYLMNKKLEEIYKCKFQEIPNKSQTIQLGYISDDAFVLGRAKIKNISLIYLGSSVRLTIE